MLLCFLFSSLFALLLSAPDQSHEKVHRAGSSRESRRDPNEGTVGVYGGHLLELPTSLVVLFPGSPSHVGEVRVITHYKFVHVVSSNLYAENGGAHLHGGPLYMPFHAVWQLQVAI